MYEQYFQLKKKPFDLIPNPEFLFMSKTHKRTKLYLEHGIQDRAGFILLTGEIGCGKTTIVRNILQRKNGNTVYAGIFNTKLDSDQLIASINDDFGLNIENKNKVLLMRDLNNFLIEQYAKGFHVTLIIDEAQSLSPELLDEIRMLSNLETNNIKLLQIVLVGQPELKNIIAKPELRQLRQRIGISCHIGSLNRNETGDYIIHRLKVAGNGNAVTFEAGVIEIIHNFSRGVPRLINIICDHLMLSAFVDKTKLITGEMTKEIVDELDMGIQFWNEDAISTHDTINRKELIHGITNFEQETGSNAIERTGAYYLNDILLKLEYRINRLGEKTHADIARLGKKIIDVSKEMQDLQKKISISRDSMRGMDRNKVHK